MEGKRTLTEETFFNLECFLVDKKAFYRLTEQE